MTKSAPFFLISGPCAIENKDISFEIAERLKKICSDFDIPLIFKGSYRKANRTRLDSFTGIGDEKALSILSEIRMKYSMQVTTDVHETTEIDQASEIVDILQIPAFLCRQTDLLLKAAKSGCIVNIKKGQFMSPSSMKFAVQKIIDSGNQNVWLTERGTSFGYGDLIVDFRGLVEMQNFTETVVMDCTHSLQKPNQSSGLTGGSPEYISLMANLALTAGVSGLFIETHPNPARALSDGANMLALDRMEEILEKAIRIKTAL